MARSSAIRATGSRVIAPTLRRLVLTLLICPSLTGQAKAPDLNGHDWHISPMEINVLVGDASPLEALDDAAQEVHGVAWSVDDPTLASITEEDGQTVVHAHAAGTVRVTATLEGDERQVEIKIWPGEKLPEGTTKWRITPLGRAIDVLPAMPVEGSDVDVYFLSQDNQRAYVRGYSAGGIQRSIWTLPETATSVEFVCGDNLGGIIVSAVHPYSYTVYAVGPDAKLRWQHSFQGIRKGHALSAAGLLHLLTQSSDRMAATITAWDEATGGQKFSLAIPGSELEQTNVTASGGNLLCAPPGTIVRPLAFFTSNLFIGVDGDAYAAFVQNRWNIKADDCMAGAVIDTKRIYFSAENNLVLWRIHPDGGYASTVIGSETHDHLPVGAQFRLLSPTGAIIPDGFGGVLLSVRSVHSQVFMNVNPDPEEFIYRITAEGAVAYKFLLPAYQGPLHDEMVLGSENSGFATRGGSVIKFDVRTGAKLWQTELGGSLEVFAALANGGVQVRKFGESIRVDEPAKK